MKKRIISFSLYGEAPRYLNGALENIPLWRRFYPEWECRFYVSREIPLSIIGKMNKEGATVITKKRRNRHDGMFWRMLPINERNLDALIVRDVDSRLSEREALAVGEWLRSGKAFHIMRDHPWHTAAIMGGMWGVRGNILPHLWLLFGKWLFMHIDVMARGIFRKQLDQQFLHEIVYPRIRHSVVIHSEFIRFEGERVTPFPSERENDTFVGQDIDDGGMPLHGLDLSPNPGLDKALPVPDWRLSANLRRKAVRILDCFINH